MHILDTANAQYSATTTASADVATALVSGQRYEVAASVLSTIAQGADPTAALAAGSSIVTPERPVYIDGIYGAVLAARTVAGAGHVTVTPVYDLG